MGSLVSFLEDYPQIELATQQNNQEILDLVESVPMNLGSMALSYRRSPNFFSLLEEQSDSAAVFLFRNMDLSLGGVAVISIRKSWSRGAASSIAYCSDLRTAPGLSRKVRMQWWKCYGELLRKYKTIDELQEVETFYTAVLDENKAAVRLFTNSKRDIVYEPIQSYSTVSLLGRYPWAGNSVCSSITLASAEDTDELVHFLNTRNQDKVGGYLFNDKIEAHKFIVARDKQGEIMACVGLFESSASRSLVVEKTSLGLQLLGAFSFLIGGKSARVGEELKTLYMTHLEFAGGLDKKHRLKIVSDFLGYIYKKKLHNGFHSVSYLSFENDFLDRAARQVGGLAVKTSGTLYEVLHTENLSSFKSKKAKGHYKYGFELAMA